MYIVINKYALYYTLLFQSLLLNLLGVLIKFEGNTETFCFLISSQCTSINALSIYRTCTGTCPVPQKH